MKLYTEEQVKQMIEKSRETGLTAEYLILANKGIELPSDEEIEKLFPKINTLYEALGRLGMIEGAKQLRDKIQGGNNSVTSKKTHLCLGFTPSFQPSPKVATIENVPCKECGRYLHQHPSVSYTIENKKSNK